MASRPLVLVTRPAPDDVPFAEALEAAGFKPVLCPGIRIEPAPDAEAPAGAAALAFTSSNGVRAFAVKSAERAFRVYAVGPATAAAARQAGFWDILEAEGDVASLARLIATTPRAGDAAGGLVHVAGRDRAGDLVNALAALGVEARLCVLYHAVELERAAPAATAAFRAGASVALFSARSADIFLRQMNREGLAGAARRAVAVCLSEAVAARCANAFARVLIAPRPGVEAVIDTLIGDLNRN